MVEEEYDLAGPLAFLDSEHFFSLLKVTLRDYFIPPPQKRDDFSVFSVF